jgi:hypothetical protein
MIKKNSQLTRNRRKDRKIKQVLSKEGYQWEGIRVKEGEYDGCILYSYMKTE